MVRIVLKSLALTSLVVASSGCKLQLLTKIKAAGDPSERRWLAKAARTLFISNRDLPPAEMAALAALGREQAVDQMLADPRFQDTVLDFNLFFIGQKISDAVRVEIDGKFYLSGYRDNQALISAREFATNGDYLTLFHWHQPYLLSSGESMGEFKDSGQTDLGLYKRGKFQQLSMRISEMRQIIKSSDLATSCAARYPQDAYSTSIFGLLLESGTPYDLALGYTDRAKDKVVCGEAERPWLDQEKIKQDMLLRLAQLEADLPALSQLIAQFDNNPKIVASLIPIAQSAISSLDPPTAFSAFVWHKILNSSTNMNRARAAYMLKTYFCDDLTPLQVQAPALHAESKHASDPGCQSCHYKLDPMAGFFRFYGIEGADLSDVPVMTFDDNLTIGGPVLQNYLASWNAAPGVSPALNIGYIRSTTNLASNSYGESMEDLFNIILQAPETKVCLVKRLAEYVLGVDQVYDRKWIEGMAAGLQTAAKSQVPGDSSAAFKQVVKTLVLSKTFETDNPEHGKCYDFAPGATSSTLPCAVSAIIDKNCASCHRGEGAPAGLDLTAWDSPAQGGVGFRHLDSAKKQIDAKRTLSLIACALSPTPDCGEVTPMPYKRDMDATEKAALFQWSQQAVSEK